LPTKFAAYLSAGLPLIILAHRETSAAKMAAAYNVGLLAHSSDVSTLSRQLAQALADSNPKRTYRPEIIRCACAEFDATQMRRKLWECLSSAKV
jgi:hypothetical protein